MLVATTNHQHITLPQKTLSEKPHHYEHEDKNRSEQKEMPILSPFKLASQICHSLFHFLLYTDHPGIHVVELAHVVFPHSPDSLYLATELAISQSFLFLLPAHKDLRRGNP